MSPTSKPPFVAVIKDNYISITLPKTNKTFSITDSHPHFKKIASTLKAKNWAKIPPMIDLAEAINNISSGVIKLEKGVVKYKGVQIDGSLSRRILDLHRAGHDIKFMLRFMNNLYQNPDSRAQHELYDFLKKCNLPITDDGCFVAYKAVQDNYTDCHTGKISNSAGQIVQMPRSAVDAVRQHECSNGLHFCSRGYLQSFGGARVMAIKINPKDVVSIPTDYGYTKGRCSKYEVLMELGAKDVKMNQDGHAMLEEQPLVEVRVERMDLLKKLLANPSVKRAIRSRKLSRSTLIKASSARLRSLAEKFEVASKPVAKVGPSRLFLNNLAVARKAAKKTREEMAGEMDVAVKTITKLEGKEAPTVDEETAYLAALSTLVGFDDPRRGAVSFPKSSGLLAAYDKLGKRERAEVRA